MVYNDTGFSVWDSSKTAAEIMKQIISIPNIYNLAHDCVFFFFVAH